LLTCELKLDLFILITLVCSAELLTDFSYTDFTVSYRQCWAVIELQVIELRNRITFEVICNW